MKFVGRVSYMRVLSSAALIWFTFLSVAQAHEVLPAIGDLRVADGRVTVEVRANIEGFVAGVDLSEVADTNESAAAETYDSLRALEPSALQDRFTAFWPQMADGITLRADGQALAPVLESVTIDPVGDVALPRTSTFTFSADVPAGTEALQIGWASEFGALVIRQMDVPEPFDGYLEGGAVSDPIALAGGNQATGWESFVDYIPVGFDHIVPKGLDHILFVLGLFFLAARFRPLLIQVSLFTLAHTITLALAALGHTKFLDNFFLGTFGIEFIAVVEPLIALSIVYVAVENIFTKGISPWRPFVIFIFGLLHGLGFASVLAEFGLPEATFVPALIGFNVGVEVGQLFVIAVMFLCVWQALRVDRGRNEVAQGFALYGVLFAIAMVLIALNPAGLETLLENPVWLFAAPLAAIFAFCAMSIHFRDHLEAYRRIVAVPASLGIAVVGAYWFIERTVL